ncbi:hypothetical protein CRG98_033003 [Punica granatum]|uniref:Uncharacterized protein n=1 Tax=Punica granatum TaxID=22663 RepID=A0A2I0IRP3_PUNGR|nr:hypothetical protein CRG98_033003 [Punica granatum]
MQEDGERVMGVSALVIPPHPFEDTPRELYTCEEAHFDGADHLEKRPLHPLYPGRRVLTSNLPSFSGHRCIGRSCTSLEAPRTRTQNAGSRCTTHNQASYCRLGMSLMMSPGSRPTLTFCGRTPLIVLYYPSRQGDHLYSYDTEEDLRVSLDCNLPAPPAPPSYAHLRLIFQEGKVAGEVLVQGLKQDRVVIHALCRRSSDKGSLIFHIFMEGIQEVYARFHHDLPYAKVRLQTKGYKFAEDPNETIAQDLLLEDKEVDEAVAAAGITTVM